MRKIVAFGSILLVAAGAAAYQSGKQIVTAGQLPGLPFSPAVKAGGLIFLSGALATDESGRVVAGDITAQTKRVLDNLGKVLEAAGSSMDQVASVNVYLKKAADFPAMNEAYQGFWPKDPPVRTTVVANLVVPEALIEISMIAIPRGGERKVIHPGDWIKSPSTYSYGIKSGDTLFLAGLVSRSGKDNAAVAGDMKIQTKTVMDNGAEILKAAGMSLSDVVCSRVFITDVANFQTMNEVYRSCFPKDPPARATVVAALMSPQYLVEITMTAVKADKRLAITAPGPDGSQGRPNPNLSSAIQVGNRLYLSGMLGNLAGNETDITAQTRETLVRIGRTLKAAGFDWSHVVDGVVYITDAGRFAGMNEAYSEVFRSDFPARATVETGLVSPTGLVEIMFTAVK